MKVIKRISCDIENQIDMAQDYAKTAMELKEGYPNIAKVYADAAQQVLAIMGTFHTQVVNVIDEYKKTKGDIPKEMQMLYDILHEKHISDTIIAKNILALYKES